LAPALAGVLLALSLGACCEEDATTPLPVLAGMQGTVLDTLGAPVSDAAVGVVFHLPGPDWPRTGKGTPAGIQPAGVDSVSPPPSPADFRLRQNYPNPFWGYTTISFELDRACWVQATVLDLSARPIRTLVDSPQPAGLHHVAWNGLNDGGVAMPNGYYRFRLQCRQTDPDSLLFSQTVGGMFINCFDLGGFASQTTTAADGRFFLPFLSLPVGQEVPLIEETGDSLGVETVPATVHVMARSRARDGWQEVDLGDLSMSVPVTVVVE